MKVEDGIVKKLLNVLPYKFIRHYIYPHLVRAEKKEYDHESFWNSYYKSAQESEFSDGVTVAHNYDFLTSEYHYRLVEKSIIEIFVDLQIKTDHMKVIDIGSGAGHWINFYHELFKPEQIKAFEISAPAVELLTAKFKDNPEIFITRQDIASKDYIPDFKADIVNAIGVMFHLVDDSLWQQGIINISKSLNVGGYLIVGGHFGLLTRAVQFHNRDNYNDWGQYTSFVSLKELFALSKKDTVLVNKKIRSIFKWKKTAAKAGLKYVRMYKNISPKGFIVPENNLIVFRKERDV